MLLLAMAAALVAAQTHNVRTFADGSFVETFNLPAEDQQCERMAGFLADSASEYAEWVSILAPALIGPDPQGGQSNFQKCMDGALKTCGQGKVCSVSFTAGGTPDTGTCAFTCAVTGAVPPCGPPATVPAVTPTH
jgi:hypothetical protein